MKRQHRALVYSYSATVTPDDLEGKWSFVGRCVVLKSVLCIALD